MTQAQVMLPGVSVGISAFGDDWDFWETRREAVEPLFHGPLAVDLRVRCWHLIEPTAGRGALLEHAHALAPGAFAGTTACELHPGRFAELDAGWRGRASLINADFLTLGAVELDTPSDPNLWLANPPYSKPREGIGVDILEHCLRLARPLDIVAFLMPLDFATGVERCERIHDRWPCSMYPLRRRPAFGDASGSAKRPFAWFVFDFGEPKREWRAIG